MSEGNPQSETTAYGLLMPGAGQQTPDPDIYVDTTTVRIMERCAMDGTVTRKIGDGDWKPVGNPFAQPAAVRIDIDPEMSMNVPVRQVDPELVRRIFECGHSDNTITVSRRDRVTFADPVSGCLVIHCGHCHADTSADVNSGHFCCRWAGAMYQKYFEHNLAGSSRQL